MRDLSPAETRSRLNGLGLALQVGPFVARVTSHLPVVQQGIRQLYADYTVTDAETFADFCVSLELPTSLRRWYRPQVNFVYDGIVPFKPLPVGQAYAMFEWGLNWCISSTALQYLIVHAAVVENQGSAVLLPGAPGVGKSTLCAALVSRGWRLLSDEMALIIPSTLAVVPVPRPVSLKNASIEIMKKYASDLEFGPISFDTAKGTVAHLKPPIASVQRAAESATLRWIVFPLYVRGARLKLVPRAKSDSMLHLARNAMTYDALGSLAFETLCNVVDHCDCYDLRYESLDDAIDRFGTLASDSLVA